MKIDIVSDLHVDAHFNETQTINPPGQGPQFFDANGDFLYFDFDWYRNPGSDVLVIAGDISNNLTVTVAVLQQAKQVYDTVIFVDGNHEHHNLNLLHMPRVDIESTNNVFMNEKILINACNYIGVVYLSGSGTLSHTIGDTTFIGSNSWYDWKAMEVHGFSYEVAYERWKKSNRDSVRIDFGFVSPEVLANEFADQLEEELRYNENNVVLVTHTSPNIMLHQIRQTDYEYNASTASFVNSRIAEIIDANVKTCIYGHTHDWMDVDILGVRYVNNAYGYPHETKQRHWKMKQIEV